MGIEEVCQAFDPVLNPAALYYILLREPEIYKQCLNCRFEESDSYNRFKIQIKPLINQFIRSHVRLAANDIKNVWIEKIMAHLVVSYRYAELLSQLDFGNREENIATQHDKYYKKLLGEQGAVNLKDCQLVALLLIHHTKPVMMKIFLNVVNKPNHTSSSFNDLKAVSSQLLEIAPKFVALRDTTTHKNKWPHLQLEGSLRKVIRGLLTSIGTSRYGFFHHNEKKTQSRNDAKAYAVLNYRDLKSAEYSSFEPDDRSVIIETLIKSGNLESHLKEIIHSQSKESLELIRKDLASYLKMGPNPLRFNSQNIDTMIQETINTKTTTDTP